MIKMEQDTVIDDKMMDRLIEEDACEEALTWLQEEPRTWGETLKHNPEWCAWAFVFIKELEIDLEGLGSAGKARVMAYREDCPVDLKGLNSYDKAWVMRKRGLTND